MHTEPTLLYVHVKHPKMWQNCIKLGTQRAIFLKKYACFGPLRYIGAASGSMLAQRATRNTQSLADRSHWSSSPSAEILCRPRECEPRATFCHPVSCTSWSPVISGRFVCFCQFETHLTPQLRIYRLFSFRPREPCVCARHPHSPAWTQSALVKLHGARTWLPNPQEQWLKSQTRHPSKKMCPRAHTTHRRATNPSFRLSDSPSWPSGKCCQPL